MSDADMLAGSGFAFLAAPAAAATCRDRLIPAFFDRGKLELVLRADVATVDVDLAVMPKVRRLRLQLPRGGKQFPVPIHRNRRHVRPHTPDFVGLLLSSPSM